MKRGTVCAGDLLARSPIGPVEHLFGRLEADGMVLDLDRLGHLALPDDADHLGCLSRIHKHLVPALCVFLDALADEVDHAGFLRAASSRLGLL
jgi:hypothetical protein